LRLLLAALAAIVVLTIAASAAVPYLVDTPRVQSLIASSATQAIGRPVRFSGLTVWPLPLPVVKLKGLEVADDPRFSAAPFLKLDTGTLRLSLLALLAGRVEFTEVILTQPSIALIEDGQGHWNVASLGAGTEAHPVTPRSGRTGSAASGGTGPGGGLGAASAVLGSRVKIEKGFVTYTTRAGGAKYRVEGLDLTLTGTGTEITVDGGLRVNPGDLLVTISQGFLAPRPSRATLFDAPVRAQVTLEGRDVADLVAAVLGPAPAIAGALKGTLAVTGTLGAPRAVGGVELSRLSVTETRAGCPAPPKRTLSLPAVTLAASWEDDRFRARPLSTSLGGGTITTNLTVALGRGGRVQVDDLSVRGLPIEKVLVDFLCQGYAVTGPLDLTGAFSMSPGDVWKTLSGKGRFRIGAGRVVGSQALALLDGVLRMGGALSWVLSGDLAAPLGSSPFEFESVTGSYRISDGVVTTRDLLYTSRAMNVGVSGQYALPTGALNVDLVVSHGRGQVTAKVTGTSASPFVRVVPASLLRDVDTAKVQRGLQEVLKRLR
jgi:hypothetical protein